MSLAAWRVSLAERWQRGPVWALVVASLLIACSPPAPAPAPAPAPPVMWVEPLTGMELLYVPPGRFLIGSLPQEVGREAQEVLHSVVLTRGFYLGRDEVTQEQWQRVMGENPSHFADCGPRCPVENVTYLEILAFLDRLAALGGARLRLPTEAEWERACRAGTQTPYATGTILGPQDANYDDRSPVDGSSAGAFRGGPMPVGSFPANPWGFHDLHGNVWEWCEDWHCPYPEAEEVDPLRTCDSGLRVIRGGSWYYGDDSARCALRYTHRPQDRGPSLGFRLALDAPVPEAARSP